MEDNELFNQHSQNHVADSTSQGISGHGIGFILLKYFLESAP